ncbi:MAG: metallophosphoesterase [Lentisphaeria bacterium]|nr:metallophosphoesterase [Lentisphaeria bacterium]
MNDSHSYLHFDEPDQLKLCLPGGKQAKFLVLGDAHCKFDDDRGIPYQEYTNRMKRCSPHFFPLVEEAIEKAEKENYDAILMLGDFLSFPSIAGVEKFAEIFQSSKVPCLYTSGNHDWHFEGMSGSELELREKWTKELLAPLYGDRNPLFYAEIIRGFKIIMIDNSIYEILPEQLEFLKQELSDNIPAFLGCHIPLYVPGRDIFFGCGHPQWNAENDPYWEIERRPKWRTSGHTETTFEFHRTIMETPNLLGIFAGHTHKFSLDPLPGKFQAVAAMRHWIDFSIEPEH